MKPPSFHIRAIGAAFGTIRVDNVAQAAAMGKDGEFVSHRIGALSLVEAAPDQTACALAESAVREALDKAGLAPDDIGLLVFVSQNPDHGGLPHNSAILHGALGMPPATICFDVGLGCSGYVYGLQIVSSMMAATGVENALLVTSDQYRRHLAAGDVNTRLLFGDAACATVIGTTGPLRLMGCTLGTDGSAHQALIRRDDAIAMNGRAVFTFSRSVVPNAIRDFCAEQGVPLDSVDQLLLHQGSRAIVNEIRVCLGLDTTCVPLEMEGTGNAVSSSLPLMLMKRLDQVHLRRFVLAGFGVGLSWGVAWLERNDAYGGGIA